MTDSIETPCIGLCTLDGEGVCMGCMRTFREIADWPFMSAGERREIMSVLKQRGTARDANAEGRRAPGPATDSFKR